MINLPRFQYLSPSFSVHRHAADLFVRLICTVRAPKGMFQFDFCRQVAKLYTNKAKISDLGFVFGAIYLVRFGCDLGYDLGAI